MNWKENNIIFESEFLDACINKNLCDTEEESKQVICFLIEDSVKTIRKFISNNCFELDISNSYNAKQGYI